MKVDKHEIERVGGGVFKIAMGILWMGLTVVLMLASIVFDPKR